MNNAILNQIKIVTVNQALRATDLPGILGHRLQRLPFVLRLLSENHLRSGGQIETLLTALDAWLAGNESQFEFTFQPNRILMHDTTCTPALADIAGLRDAVAESGGDPTILTPVIPVDVSVDHSLSVDFYASSESFLKNSRNEISRNAERYAFMKWASHNLDGLTVHPPGTGIMHTINLEQLASILEVNEDGLAHPDMLLGTDSHTPMINGIGVLGWGIGGLEAEAVMFGQPTTLAMPKVVGVHLSGHLPTGAMPTDLALEVTQLLRCANVTGQFVEFFGPGVSGLTADTRAVLANMAPEYGATTGFFPVDDETLAYLERTARPKSHSENIQRVFKAMGLWFDPHCEPHFDRVLELNLETVGPSISGPRRPQDKCLPSEAKVKIETAIGRALHQGGENRKTVPDGAVGVAAITSCTNTSDPYMLVAAGLLARKAGALGLHPPSWVKTSLAPGSPSARAYLERSGLLTDLSSVGFDIVGFGCTTCIGNPGPLPDVIEDALQEGKAVTAILSGNRNFPGRVHPKLDLAYLASPPLVVAYALKGSVSGDILKDSIGKDVLENDVFLHDIWPSADEITAALREGLAPSDVPKAFHNASNNRLWQDLAVQTGPLFSWNKNSRTLRRPKFTIKTPENRLGAYNAIPLAVYGDDITTDHISPAGWVDPNCEAGAWLQERGGDPNDLNVYASYRGNWEVMLRGLFTNKLATNHLGPELKPAHTKMKGGKIVSLVEAAATYTAQRQATVVFSGERYGMGSSRDWAAKGVALLNIRAVIARSFERIHRTNLIGMGVVPIVITCDFNPQFAGISPSDSFQVNLPAIELAPNYPLKITRRRGDGSLQSIQCRVAAETEQDIDLLRQGGVLAKILNAKL